MMIALLIVILGLSPSLLSIWVMRQANQRAEARLRLAMEAITHRQLPLNLPADYRYVEGIGYMMGDLTCQFNARSSYLRCAVNPAGPCATCRYYQSR
ncbi:MAG: DUF6464 family protein [Elainella sp. Prado103]|jgi:hypothetical protein|nr:DUF6464 family protein [Elainella sp. Prado103]